MILFEPPRLLYVACKPVVANDDYRESAKAWCALVRCSTLTLKDLSIFLTFLSTLLALS